MKHALETAPELGVEQLEHRYSDNPGEDGDHFMDEAANEADGAAADEKQEYENVERGHSPALA
jgi:hypothetical protein